MAKKEKTTLRFKIGIGFIVLSCVFPLFGMVVPFFGLSTYLTAFLVAFFLVGGPELCLIVGAALSGKKAVQMITEKVKKLFRRGPPKPVSKCRYIVGLVALLLGNVIMFLRDYAPPLFHLKVSDLTLLGVNLVADFIIIISFFILGEQFWEKLKKLFTWEAEQ